LACQALGEVVKFRKRRIFQKKNKDLFPKSWGDKFSEMVKLTIGNSGSDLLFISENATIQKQ